SNVLEHSSLFVVKKEQGSACAHRKVHGTIVVVIAGSAADPVHCGVKASLSRHVLEFAEASIVIERHTAVHTIIGNKNVGLAVAIVVKKASSRTEERSHLWCLGR